MEAQPGKQKFYRPAEVAHLLQYRIGYVYNLIYQKRLDHLKIGGRIYVSQEHLNNWLEKNAKLVEATQ